MLTPWKESYDQPRQHIKKQRHYFANKGPSSQGYGFSSGHVWMWELDCEQSWAPKNWCFSTVVLEKTQESLGLHPILKEVSPGCSLEGLMLKLKFQYFGHLKRRVDTLEKTLMLGGIGGRMRRGRQRMRWLHGITDSMEWVRVNSGSWWWTGRPGMLRFMGSQRVGHDWTELMFNPSTVYSVDTFLTLNCPPILTCFLNSTKQKNPKTYSLISENCKSCPVSFTSLWKPHLIGLWFLILFTRTSWCEFNCVYTQSLRVEIF